MAMLEINDLHVNYGMIAALKGISFEVNEGEVISLIGANGAGKTTTLHTLTGLISAKSGSIKFNGVELTKTPAHKIVEMGIAHVPEGRRIFQNLTVLDNLKLGAFTRKDKENIPKDIQDIYERFPRLAERKNQIAGTLSGGEQQRVSLARALVNNPKVIIADEPTGNVDAEMSHEIVGLLTKINNAGTTVIMVTHEHDLVRSFQRRVIVIKNGEVVSDTPDPTHAQFTGENPKADTDMFFFDEDVEIDDVNVLPKDDEEDVFDNLENVVSEEENQGGEQ